MLIKAILAVVKYLVLKTFYLVFVLYPFVTGGLPRAWELEIFVASTIALIVVAVIWLSNDLDRLGIGIQSFIKKGL